MDNCHMISVGQQIEQRLMGRFNNLPCSEVIYKKAVQVNSFSICHFNTLNNPSSPLYGEVLYLHTMAQHKVQQKLASAIFFHNVKSFLNLHQIFTKQSQTGGMEFLIPGQVQEKLIVPMALGSDLNSQITPSLLVVFQMIGIIISRNPHYIW